MKATVQSPDKNLLATFYQKQDENRRQDVKQFRTTKRIT